VPFFNRFLSSFWLFLFPLYLGLVGWPPLTFLLSPLLQSPARLLHYLVHPLLPTLYCCDVFSSARIVAFFALASIAPLFLFSQETRLPLVSPLTLSLVLLRLSHRSGKLGGPSLLLCFLCPRLIEPPFFHIISCLFLNPHRPQSRVLPLHHRSFLGLLKLLLFRPAARIRGYDAPLFLI